MSGMGERSGFDGSDGWGLGEVGGKNEKLKSGWSYSEFSIL